MIELGKRPVFINWSSSITHESISVAVTSYAINFSSATYFGPEFI